MQKSERNNVKAATIAFIFVKHSMVGLTSSAQVPHVIGNGMVLLGRVDLYGAPASKVSPHP
jgi:hypothetical protein